MILGKIILEKQDQLSLKLTKKGKTIGNDQNIEVDRGSEHTEEDSDWRNESLAEEIVVGSEQDKTEDQQYEDMHFLKKIGNNCEIKLVMSHLRRTAKLLMAT